MTEARVSVLGRTIKAIAEAVRAMRPARPEPGRPVFATRNNTHLSAGNLC